MNTSAMEAKKEMIKRIETATKSHVTYVTEENLEDGIGVDTGYNFITGHGNDARWMTEHDAMIAAGLKFAICNKHGEEKKYANSITSMIFTVGILDFQKREYTVKIVSL